MRQRQGQKQAKVRMDHRPESNRRKRDASRAGSRSERRQQQRKLQKGYHRMYPTLGFDAISVAYNRGPALRGHSRARSLLDPDHRPLDSSDAKSRLIADAPVSRAAHPRTTAHSTPASADRAAMMPFPTQGRDLRTRRVMLGRRPRRDLGLL